MMDASRTVADVAFSFAQGSIPPPSGQSLPLFRVTFVKSVSGIVAGYTTSGEATSTRPLPTSQRTDSSTVSPAVCCGS